MSDDQLTTGQAARLLGVSPVTVRSYAMRGHLTGRKLGRDWFFTRGEVEALAANPPRRTGRPPTKALRRLAGREQEERP